MSNLKFPHLFEPITLGNVTFKNRIFGSCTSIHDLTEQNHYPTDVINAYYERKAIGGVASVGIGDATVDCVHGKAGAFHIPLDDFGAMGSLHNLANSISRHGAVAAMELQHAGMFSTGSADDGHEVWGPVAKTIERNSAIGIVETIDVLPMNDEMIQHTIDCYANAALLAKMAGYGMVVIHAGHGWLFSQFLSSKINTRTDEWGGASIENRMRFPLAVCDAIKKKCGRNFPVEVRISGDECFEGGYDQIPPMYSALKVNGRKLVDLARRGQEIERAPRPVKLYRIEIERMDPPYVEMTVDCSKGTYIRTLCHDIGERLGCGGCMTELVRESAAGFTIEQSHTLGELEQLRDRGELDSAVISPEEYFGFLPEYTVSEKQDRYVMNGNKLTDIPPDTGGRDGMVRIYTSDHLFRGVYRADTVTGEYRVVKLFM